jgi:hydrogenase maturation protein HypF
MVRDLAAAEKLVVLEDADRSLLSSPRCPVVLAPRRPTAALTDQVAPGIADLGIMLTTTPLHVELFADQAMPALIMTSANLSEEPICRSNREAVERLHGIADGFLVHDRDVVRRVDDSVVRSTPDGPLVLRRARGWVPEPQPLPAPAPTPVLAVGGHLQATACLAVDDQAFLSQHVGDLDSESARCFLREVIAGLEDFLQVKPTLIAADAHPDYPSSWLAAELARERGGSVMNVQHHLAHAAAVLAEHGRFPDRHETALAVSLDGTGWGADGTAWGGEFLGLSGDLEWHRLAHLEPLPLVGGEKAVREPWRVAAAALALSGMKPGVAGLPLSESVNPDDLARIEELAASGSWPMASGAGRLFEAAGALLGLAAVNDWEGEAAVRLEALAASSSRPAEVWEINADRSATRGLPSVALLAEAARRVLAGQPLAQVAVSLHATFCALTVDTVLEIADGSRPVVALGGGCLANRLLRAGLRTRLLAAGFEPLLATSVPPGDGGLSYGQAVLAAVATARDLEVSSSPSRDAR